jgi:hypothetical protein
MLLKDNDGSEGCSCVSLSLGSAEGNKVEMAASAWFGAFFSISVTCLMLDIGFLPASLSFGIRLSASDGLVVVSDSRFADRVLCRGLGATKISVSGLMRTAVVIFVGGLVSSVPKQVIGQSLKSKEPNRYRRPNLPTTRLILVLPFTHTFIGRSEFEVAARNWESKFCSR